MTLPRGCGGQGEGGGGVALPRGMGTEGWEEAWAAGRYGVFFPFSAWGFVSSRAGPSRLVCIIITRTWGDISNQYRFILSSFHLIIGWSLLPRPSARVPKAAMVRGSVSDMRLPSLRPALDVAIQTSQPGQHRSQLPPPPASKTPPGHATPPSYSNGRYITPSSGYNHSLYQPKLHPRPLQTPLTPLASAPAPTRSAPRI